MPATVSGVKTRPILQTEETGTMDRFGVDTLTSVEEIPVEMFPQAMRGIGARHPRFPNMAVSKVNYSAAKHGRFFRTTYIYEGFMLSLPEPTYELDVSTGEEPIQTHPDFETFAGTPATPLNGAIFLDPDTRKPSKLPDAVWFEFAVADAAPGTTNKKAGVVSYLVPGTTWNEISFSKTRPTDVGNVGKIDTPSGPAPTLPDDGTWLYIGMNYTKRGSIYEIRKTWRASSRGGWDTDIYAP